MYTFMIRSFPLSISHYALRPISSSHKFHHLPSNYPLYTYLPIHTHINGPIPQPMISQSQPTSAAGRFKKLKCQQLLNNGNVRNMFYILISPLNFLKLCFSRWVDLMHFETTENKAKETDSFLMVFSLSLLLQISRMHPPLPSTFTPIHTHFVLRRPSGSCEMIYTATSCLLWHVYLSRSFPKLDIHGGSNSSLLLHGRLLALLVSFKDQTKTRRSGSPLLFLSISLAVMITIADCNM